MLITAFNTFVSRKKLFISCGKTNSVFKWCRLFVHLIANTIMQESSTDNSHSFVTFVIVCRKLYVIWKWNLLTYSKSTRLYVMMRKSLFCQTSASLHCISIIFHSQKHHEYQVCNFLYRVVRSVLCHLLS